MLDPELVELIKSDTPQLNPKLANGLATYQMKHAEAYIDSVWRSVAKDFPPGLVYVGCKRCTPSEELIEATRRRGSRNQARRSTRKTYETARTDLYLVKYNFKYNGVDLPPRYIYLPFVGPAGSIYITGVRNNISPVLADRVISINQTSIFVRLIRDKLTFNRKAYSYQTTSLAGGVRENAHIIYSPIYHNKNEIQKVKPSVNAETCTVHYLFCKYGAIGTFKKFVGVEPIIGENLDISQFPPDKWVVCKTIWNERIYPKGFTTKRSRQEYHPTKIMIAIPRDKYTPMAKALIAGFYYIVDLFPQQMHVAYTEEPSLWMTLMGYILLPSDINAGKLYEKMSNHINSLDEYIDNIIKIKLHGIGIDVTDIYDFFAIMTENYTSWLLKNSDKINSLYGKELQIPYFTLYSITNAIVKFLYKIKASAAKKVLSENEIKSIMNSTLRARLIYSINKDNGEVSSHNYSGDNMAFKITSIMIPQSEATKSGRKGKDRGSIGDPAKRMHVSVAEFGSYSGMAKSDPSGRSKLNLHGMIDDQGLTVRNPKLIALLDDTQDKMSNVRASDNDTDSDVDISEFNELQKND